MIGSSGPKISSCMIIMSAVAPTTMVGGNLRFDFQPGSSGFAACMSVAPLAAASANSPSSRA
jgi:hypothetical protein